jgi:hypothetical protein
MQGELVSFVGIGLLVGVFSYFLVKQRIEPNRWCGFHVPQTMDDPKLWYPVNTFYGKRQLVAALSSVVTAIGLYFIPGISETAYTLACVLVYVVILGIGLVQSWRYMKKLSH